MPYTVSRQVQWPDGARVVEVSEGTLDYTNPDALSPRWPGEMDAFDDPREAAEEAIRICDLWRRNGGPEATVAHGATGGMTMPFSPCSYGELRSWAEGAAGALPRCDWCGKVLPGPHYTYPDLDGQRFCSEYCAEEAYEDLLASEPVTAEVCDSCGTVAYDHGVRGLARQASFMVEAGAALEDHVCDHREAPEDCPRCECGCNPGG